MATTSGSKRLLDISANGMAASNSMTYGGLNVATEQYVSTQISNLISSAPGALDTLNELAAALGDDANFSTTMSTALGNRLRVDTASQGLTSTQKSNGRTNLGLGSAATTASTAYATAAQGTKADTAHGWGNHAGLYAAASHSHSYLPLAGGTITGALTVSGSTTRGTYDTASQYHTGADNIVLKGNASGISSIFFESEKNGTNINHPSDFGFIQYHPYGTSTSGEANELIIGVSNDADDHLVLNAPNVNGLKFRTGVSATDYTVYHSGNLSLATLGYTGATNANYITNNNQLTNGAGYITSYVNTTYSAGTGLKLSGTTFRLNGGEIPSGANLNSYRSTGIFSQNSNSDTNSGSNWPTNNAGILEVWNDDYGNGIHCTQRYSRYNTTDVYQRNYYNGTWTAWRNLTQDTNTTYSVGDGGLTQKNFTTTLKNKLDGIEASADVTDATNVSAAGALMRSGGTMTGDLRVTDGDNNGIRFHSGGANITSVSSGDVVIQRLGQLRLGSSSSWDWNVWAGIKYDSTGNVLYIGGPAASQFTSNSSPSTIDVNFVGVDEVQLAGNPLATQAWVSSNFESGAVYTVDITGGTNPNYIKIGTLTAPGDAFIIHLRGNTYADGYSPVDLYLEAIRYDFGGPDKTEVKLRGFSTDSIDALVNNNGDVWVGGFPNQSEFDALQYLTWTIEDVRGAAIVPTSNFTVVDINSVPQPRAEIDINLTGLWDSGDVTSNFNTYRQQLGAYAGLDVQELASSNNFYAMGNSYFFGDSVFGARLDVGSGTQSNAEIRIYKGDNNVSDHIQFYNGTTRVGEIGCEDTTWLRINQETDKNIYTPRYIRADNGFYVDGTTKGINGSGNFIGGTIAGASDANVSNWDTAYTHSQAAHAPSDAEANVQSDWNATTGDAFIKNKPTLGTAAATDSTAYAAASHNHTSLTGVTSIGFAAQSSDSASISTTISGTSTFFDFNLTDDNNNDWWRWRFTPSGSTVYDAMVLKPKSNGNADLIVSGSITADNIGTAAAAATGDFAAASHTHAYADLTGLPTIPTNNNQLTNGAGYLTSSNDRVYITDSRGAARAPSYYNDRYAQWDFQNENDTGITDGDGWQALLTVSKWSSFDPSHRQEQLIFTGNDLYRRTATSDTEWGDTKKIWDSGNFNPASYLTTSGKAADSNLLDGIDSSGFLRSNADDTLTQTLVIDQRGTTQGSIAYRNDGGVYVPRPHGGNFATTSNAYTGAIAVKLPAVSIGDSDMLSFWVDIYDYAGGNEGETVSVYVYGYQYSNPINWTNQGAVILSDRTDRNYNVRFGHDGTRPIVWIGETDSTWNYLQINVRDFQAGYSADDWDRYDANWDIDIVTSLGTVIKTSTNNYPVAKYASSAGSVAWSNVSSKPASFTPTAHTHSATDINTGTLSHDRLPNSILSGQTKIGKDTSNYIAIDHDNNNSIDFFISGVWVARMEADGDLHMKGDVVAFSDIFNP